MRKERLIEVDVEITKSEKMAEDKIITVFILSEDSDGSTNDENFVFSYDKDIDSILNEIDWSCENGMTKKGLAKIKSAIKKEIRLEKQGKNTIF